MEVALASDALLLFVLKGDAFQLAPFITQAHQRGKGVVVHVDLVSGIGKDRAGIQHLRQIGVDAIITSRSQLDLFRASGGIDDDSTSSAHGRFRA